MPATALFVHVPVDKIKLVGGPGSEKWSTIFDELEEIGERVGVEVELTMKTSASSRSFKRKLRIIETWAHHGDGFYFRAIFCGVLVECFFNKRSREGWLTLDF